MGIALGAFEFLMAEGAERPWSGRVLTLGRQDTSVSARDFRIAANRLGFPPPPLVNGITEPQQPLTDGQLFAALGFNSLSALDVSMYEGADIEHDLNARNYLPDASGPLIWCLMAARLNTSSMCPPLLA